MLVRGELTLSANLLELIKKFALVPALLFMLLSGCDIEEGGDDSKVGGSHGYEGRLEVQNIKPAKENSSAEVKVRILTQKGKDIAAGDVAFDNAVEVHLKWSCWEWQGGEGTGEELAKDEIDSGSAKLTVAAGAGSGVAVIDDLPEALEVNASIFAGPNTTTTNYNSDDYYIQCEVTPDEGNILGDSPALKDFRKKWDSVLVFYNENKDFSIPPLVIGSGGQPSISLEISDIVPGDSNSQVKIKVAFEKISQEESKAVVAGDELFDNAVDINLEWSCGDYGSGSDKLTIAAGKATVEKTYRDFPKRQASDEVSCTVTATPDPEIKDEFDNALTVSETFVIDELELTVVITEEGKGYQAINYVVSEGATNLTGKINVELSCNQTSPNADYGLVYSSSDHSSIQFGKHIEGLDSTSYGDLIPWHSSGARCVLIATQGSGADRKRGRSASFLVVDSLSAVFDLNKQAELKAKAANTMTGTITFYVYPYAKPAGSERELVGYLSATAASLQNKTKLQQSIRDSTKLTSLSDGGYFIVVEDNKTMYVFYKKIGN